MQRMQSGEGGVAETYFGQLTTSAKKYLVFEMSRREGIRICDDPDERAHAAGDLSNTKAAGCQYLLPPRNGKSPSSHCSWHSINNPQRLRLGLEIRRSEAAEGTA